MTLLDRANLLVSKTPEGWAADCLACVGNHGGPLDLGHWTLRREAEEAAREHKREHEDVYAAANVCPTCGQAVRS